MNKQFQITSLSTMRAVQTVGLLLFVIVVRHGLVARADNASSTSFSARQTEIDGFGGHSSSTNFIMIQAGEMISGYASSTNFTLSAGPLAFDAFAPQSRSWRWYDDEENETPLTALAAENTAPTDIRLSAVVKLRMTLQETAGVGGTAVKFRLQYSDVSDFSSNVKDLPEIGACLPNSPWCYANASGTDNAVISTKLLSNTESCTGGVGNGCGTHNTSGASTSTFIHQANAATEYEFAVEQQSAAVNTTYFFRAFDVDEQVPVPLFGTSTYPSIVSGGADLVFVVSGVSNGTTTEGIVTDATTTATSVPLGGLTFNAEHEAAQRLTVTTNASSGYQIFMFEDQQFVNSASALFPRIDAVNANPAGWTTACATTSTGCYGYHSGDDVLAGGSARFSPNDTYARFATSADEVAFSPGAIASDTVDVVFKAQARAGQDPGAYENQITYIVVPIF